MSNQQTTCIGCPFEKASEEQCRYVCQNCNGYNGEALHVLKKRAIENYKCHYRLWNRPNALLDGGVFGCGGCPGLGEELLSCWSCPGRLEFQTQEEVKKITEESCSAVMNILSPPEKKTGLLGTLFDWFWQ